MVNGKSISLDRLGIIVLLGRLARQPGDEARNLYARVMSSWGSRPDRERVSLRFSPPEEELLALLKLPPGLLKPDVLESGWRATYRHPKRPSLEVRTRTQTKPPKRRTLKVGNKTVRLVLVECTHIGNTTNKESRMARKAAKKAVVEDELDELEGLEDLDDLEDEDVADDEPEDEVDEDADEDDEDEEEAPAPKRSRGKKAAAKPATKPARSRKTKAKAAPEPELEEDEDDEDEEPAPKRRTSKKAATSAKSSSKTSAKKSTNGSGEAVGRELPKGQLGPQAIAELVGGDCDARYVRIYLRGSEYEKPEGGRWAFSRSEAKQVAKEIKEHRKANA